MKKIIFILILCLFIITGCSDSMESKMISKKEVNDIIEGYESIEDTFIIDVREIEEYKEGHLINSINVPLSKINSILDIPEIKMDSKIIIYCRSGNRSKTAQSLLNSMGYTEVYDMGGIIDWSYDIVK